MKIVLAFFCLSLSLIAFTQSTDGISYVQQIESKAANYASYKEQIEKLKGQITDLESSKNQRLQQLIDELNAMKKQRDAEIGDMKQGFFCSQCGMLKSDMEKKGENFEDHLKRVKGVPVPAGDDKIAAIRQAWSEKIALKTVQINEFKAKDEPAVVSKKAEIEKIKKLLDQICPEIKKLSYTYEERVVEQGKKLQRLWIDPAMSAAANEHIIQDKIFLAQGKITAAEKDFREQSDELRERIKKDIEAKKENLKKDIASNRELITSLQQDLESQSEAIANSLKPKEEQLQQLKFQLRGTLTDSLRKTLTAEAVALEKEVVSLQQKLQSTEKFYNGKIKEREDQIRKLDNDSWNLTTGLSKVQEDAVAVLKKQFDIIINSLKQQKATHQSALPTAHTNFLIAADQARKKLIQFTDIIESENRRMYAAASPIQCSVSTAAQLTVSRNFNEEATCMEGLRNRDRSFPATSMDCTSKSSAYMDVYRPFIAGMNQQEIGIIKSNTSTYWYESIFK